MVGQGRWSYAALDKEAFDVCVGEGRDREIDCAAAREELRTLRVVQVRSDLAFAHVSGAVRTANGRNQFAEPVQFHPQTILSHAQRTNTGTGTLPDQYSHCENGVVMRVMNHLRDV
jgi:hypothetical protein